MSIKYDGKRKVKPTHREILRKILCLIIILMLHSGKHSCMRQTVNELLEESRALNTDHALRLPFVRQYGWFL